MAKTKISALTTLADGSIAIGDLIPIVDIDDTSQAASGTTKKVTITSLASAVATAFSGDSPTFVNLNTTGTTTLGDSGDATTVNGTLGVTGNLTIDTDTLFVDAANNRVGIGTVSPNRKLSIVDSGGPIVSLVRTSNRFELSADNSEIDIGARDAGDVHIMTGAGTRVTTFKSGGNVGIGTTNPNARLSVSNNTATLPAIITGAVAQFGGVDATDATVQIDAFGSIPIFLGRRANGTAASPTALVSGDYFMILNGRGYGATAYSTNNAASIRFGADENWTDTGWGSRIEFLTMANTTTTQSTRMTIKNDGNVGIGETSPTHQLHLSLDSARKPTTTTWVTTSDERLKENIENADLNICYNIVKDLELKRFAWKKEVYNAEQAPDRTMLGWIAQDVKKVFPKAVGMNKFTGVKIEDGFELVEEDVFIETEKEIENKEIKFINGKYVEIITKSIQKNKEQQFDEFDLLDEKGEVVGKHKVAKKEKVEKIKYKQEVIEDCLDLNADQLAKVVYGAVQLLIQKVEILESKNV